jgi:dihydroorotase
MGPSVGDLFFTSNEELENALEKYKNQNISFHCEDPKILEANKGAQSHEAKRPPQAEISAVDFALKMIEKYNLVGKICHCSTVEGINKIIDAKKGIEEVHREIVKIVISHLSLVTSDH